MTTNEQSSTTNNIKLKDIIIPSFFEETPQNIPDWQKTLIKYGVQDCQTLYDYMMSGNPDFDHKKFTHIISYAQLTAKSENPPEVFEFTHREGKGSEVFNTTDKLVHGDKLPIFPLIGISVCRERIRFYNIETIKYLLGKITIDGKNGINLIAKYTRLINFQRIVYAIKFYDNQLSRTAANIPDLENYNGNLFTENEREKEILVRAHIKEAIDYLIETGEEFIWGPLSERSKDLLRNSSRTSEYKKRLIDILRDYMTLEELMDDPIKDGTLKRFILKPLDKH